MNEYFCKGEVTMEINVNTKTIYINDTIFENSSDEAVECDVTLPDYCPDVKKIMKCAVSPRLVSARCAGDRVNIEANAAIRIIYASDDNRIFCYEKTVPFSKSVDVGKQVENPCVKVELRAAYANIRALSARKLEVRGSVGVDVKVTAKREEQIVCDAQNCGIQLLKDCVGASSFVGETVKNISLTETVEVGDGKPPVLQIVRVSSEIFDAEEKTVSNKALLKGNLRVNILYIPDDDEQRPQTFVHSMPISQIIDLDGMSDKTDNVFELRTNGVDVGVKTNASGERRLIDIDAGIIATLTSSQKIEEALPTDCFSTKYDVDVLTKPVTFNNLSERVCDKIAVKSTEKINGIKIDEIYDVRCDKVKAAAKLSEGQTVISGEATVSVLGRDDSGIPFYAERNVEFEKSIPTKADAADTSEIKAKISEVDVGYILGGEDTLELRLNMAICVDIYNSKSVRLISSVTLDPDSKKQPSPSFTVYFADSGETLWDIARKFNTNVDDIINENDPSALTSDRRILYIPTI